MHKLGLVKLDNQIERIVLFLAMTNYKQSNFQVTWLQHNQILKIQTGAFCPFGTIKIKVLVDIDSKIKVPTQPLQGLCSRS